MSFSILTLLRGRNELRRVAIRRLGWRRTARPCESQEQRLFCQVQPCRPSGSKPAGPTATSVAGLRWGRLRPARPKGSQKQHPIHLLNSVGFGPRAPGVGQRPSAQARRPKGSQEHSQQVRICHPSGPKPAGPTATPVAGLRGGRLRPARLYESQKHSPKLDPILRPVFASLRLRLRSAAFAVARWDFISILLSQNE